MLEYDKKKINIPNDLFVEALNAEGIPSLRGYNFSLNEHRIIKSPFTRRCPLGCPYYGKKIDYAEQVFPVSSQACQSTVWIWHYAVLLGNERDMDDVFFSIKKIIDNFQELS